jgi:hypothetical protein
MSIPIGTRLGFHEIIAPLGAGDAWARNGMTTIEKELTIEATRMLTWQMLLELSTDSIDGNSRS